MDVAADLRRKSQTLNTYKFYFNFQFYIYARLTKLTARGHAIIIQSTLLSSWQSYIHVKDGIATSYNTGYTTGYILEH